jgi:FKBP-type peptidyl-prolyl cis-trans isomerase FklB
MTDINSASSDIAKFSYGVGRQMGDQLRGNRIDGIDVDRITAGIRDVFDNVECPLSMQEMEAAFRKINTIMQERAAEEAEEAKAAGIRFLEENAARPEVTVTDSGLQYEVLVAGEGETPSLDSTVRTHYHGTFTDGKVFDSSLEHGQPAEFPVKGVISGWTEALQMMKAGSKWRLTVPAHLAYGEQGSSGAIPPHSTLVFEVELLAII